ncbi:MULTISPECIES: hypothetical protein [Pyrobaculum]|uniref:hypothetical protein n=1 Tax=Pyrobaculum TaxID=2276 RepID=UPI000FFC81B8|nr:hypothetical protein [Pyrobaculum arsenaticum]MCY0890969.1 hypothetical protein [Pyrobaculum arsenaticum]
MECNAVVEYLGERGVKAERKSIEMVVATVGALKIGFWCPREEFPHFDDVEEVRRSLGVDTLDVLIVVSFRPYVLVDYLYSLFERAQRWYGMKIDVRLLGVSSVELETGLEDALARAFVEKPQKLGNGVASEYLCPQCGAGPLYLFRQEKFFSRKYRERVVESIYGCNSCSFRVRRVDLLD